MGDGICKGRGPSLKGVRIYLISMSPFYLFMVAIMEMRIFVILKSFLNANAHCK